MKCNATKERSEIRIFHGSREQYRRALGMALPPMIFIFRERRADFEEIKPV